MKNRCKYFADVVASVLLYPRTNICSVDFRLKSCLENCSCNYFFSIIKLEKLVLHLYCVTKDILLVILFAYNFSY